MTQNHDAPTWNSATTPGEATRLWLSPEPDRLSRFPPGTPPGAVVEATLKRDAVSRLGLGLGLGDVRVAHLDLGYGPEPYRLLKMVDRGGEGIACAFVRISSHEFAAATGEIPEWPAN